MWNSIKVTSIRVVQPTTSQENPRQWYKVSSRIEFFHGFVATTIVRLQPYWFFLWVCLKKRVFQNETIIIGTLEENITKEIRQTDGTTLRRTIDNTQRRLAEDGGHLNHRVWCQFVQHATTYVSYQYYTPFIRSWSMVKYLGFLLCEWPYIILSPKSV